MNSLRIFDLKENARVQIARCMDYLELISLSLVSKRSKQLVTSLNLRCTVFQFSIYHTVFIQVRRSANYEDYVRFDFDFNYEDFGWNAAPHSVEFDVRNPEAAEVGNEGGGGRQDVVEIEDGVGNGNEEAVEDEEQEPEAEREGELAVGGNGDEVEQAIVNVDEQDEENSEGDSYDDDEDYEYDAPKDNVWTHQGLTVRQWAHHLHSIFHAAERVQVEFYCSNQPPLISLESIRDNLPPFDELYVWAAGVHDINERSKVNFRNVLRMFAPFANVVRFLSSPFNDRYSSQHLMIQNTHKTALLMQTTTLDDLLCANAQIVIIGLSPQETFPVTEMNRFFKCWIQGSNPRVSGLKVEYRYDALPDMSIVLRGIKHTQITDDSYRIRSECGKVATITNTIQPMTFFISFRVYDQFHCCEIGMEEISN